MRRAISYLLILCVPLLLGLKFVSGKPATAGAWYYSVGSDNYGTEELLSSNSIRGSLISVTGGTKITKIALKLTQVIANDVKISLMDACSEGNCTRLDVGCTLSSPSPGWAVCTLGTPYDITTPITVSVVAMNNTDGFYVARNATTGSGMWNLQDYAAFPPATMSTSISGGACDAFAVWAE